MSWNFGDLYTIDYYSNDDCAQDGWTTFANVPCGQCRQGWADPSSTFYWKDFRFDCTAPTPVPPRPTPPPPRPPPTAPVGPGLVVNASVYALSQGGTCSLWPERVQTNFGTCYVPSRGMSVKFTWINTTAFAVAYYMDGACLFQKAAHTHDFRECFNDKPFGWLAPFPDLKIGWYNNTGL